MKRADPKKVLERTNRAKHRSVYIYNWLAIMFPVFNGFYLLWAGGQNARVAEHAWTTRLLYLIFALFAFALPLTALLISEHFEQAYLSREAGKLALWVSYGGLSFVLSVIHSRIQFSLGTAFEN